MKLSKIKKLTILAVSALLLAGCTGGPGDQSTSTSQGGQGSNIQYTYNTYLETKPKTWNTHNWETNDESYITAFTEMGFYDLQLNSTKDGYEIVCEMASDFPKDVSSQITDDELIKYGYKGNVSEGFVWDIELNEDACWEDGTPINAESYIESMKLQLDHEMVNFRADSYYAANFVIANAENYNKQQRSTIEPLYDHIIKDTGKYDQPDFVCTDSIHYINAAKYTPYVTSIYGSDDAALDKSFYDVLDQAAPQYGTSCKLAAQRIIDFLQYFVWKYEDHDGDFKSDWDEINEANVKDDSGNVYWNTKLSSIKKEMLNFDIPIEFDGIHEKCLENQKVLVRKEIDNSKYDNGNMVEYTVDAFYKDMKAVVAGCGRGSSTFAKEWSSLYPLFGSVFNDTTQEWDGETSGVGLVATGDYTIRLYLAKAITALDLKFALSSNWLVNVPLYKNLIIDTGGLKATQYATPSKGVASYMSYGPYKLTAMEKDKSFRIEKNDKWYGYHDGKHEGQFQMECIYTRIIPDHNTALQEFLAGNLDDFALNRNDMKTYGGSSRLTHTYESYTQKISINSDRAKLLSRQKAAGTNKTVLANKDFRKGLSLSLNRVEFASTTTAGSKASTNLLNDLYLTDVESGEMYRNTVQGKSVYNRVYNQLGGTHENPSALPETAQGYNFEMAKWYVAEGLKTELTSSENGHILPNDKIDIEFRVYDNESETTIDALNFINTAFTKVVAEAVKMLQADGTLKSNQNITIGVQAEKDEDYYSTAQKGNYDLIFSIWGGAAIAPINLMQVYCDSTFTQTCEYGIKGKQNLYKVKIDEDATFDSNGNLVENPNNIKEKSLEDWWTYINDMTENDPKDSQAYKTKHQKRLNVLAGIEVAILDRFEAIPLVARGTSSITSFKVENGSENYINLIGYGGVRHMTFNRTDAEWAQFVKDHNNNLSNLYKD